MPTLSSHNLSYAYKGKEALFSNLNFKVSNGKILAIAGANGSGKSTLISILAGILNPSSGEIRFGNLSGAEALHKLKLSAALVPQEIEHWLLGETVEEDLSLGLDLSDSSVRSRLELLIERWELSNLLKEASTHLSLGQKKRLALVAALARNSEVLLLDEPFSGLDWPGVKLMLKDLEMLKECGLITIMVTHETNFSENLIDAWLLLKAGRESLFGSGPEIYNCFEEYDTRPRSKF